MITLSARRNGRKAHHGRRNQRRNQRTEELVGIQRSVDRSERVRLPGGDDAVLRGVGLCAGDVADVVGVSILRPSNGRVQRASRCANDVLCLQCPIIGDVCFERSRSRIFVVGVRHAVDVIDRIAGIGLSLGAVREPLPFCNVTICHDVMWLTVQPACSTVEVGVNTGSNRETLRGTHVWAGRQSA